MKNNGNRYSIKYEKNHWKLLEHYHNFFRNMKNSEWDIENFNQNCEKHIKKNVKKWKSMKKCSIITLNMKIEERSEGKQTNKRVKAREIWNSRAKKECSKCKLMQFLQN